MKKILAGLMAASVLAGVAHAAVFSQNAVGFINVEVDAEELVALTIPFANMDSDDGKWTFKDTPLADAAPTASTVYFWDGASWAPYSKGRNGFATDKVLEPGEAFFFKPKQAMTITLSGEVPDEASTPVAITGAANLTAVGNPYPVAVKFTDTALADQATTASTVYFWDGASWAPYSKGRNGFATDHELAPGEGFFFKTNAKDDSTEWTVEKPYEYP
jgi:hypothetical protein